MSKTFKDRKGRNKLHLTVDDKKKYDSWFKKCYEYITNKSKNKLDDSGAEI